MRNINEIDKRIKNLLGKYKLTNPKSVSQYLSEVLQTDEEIEAFAIGYVNGKKTNLLTTNKRIILFNKGLIQSMQIEIPIEKISSIVQHKGLFTGEIHIWDGSSKVLINNIPVNQIGAFIDNTNQQINNYKSFKIEVNKTVEKDITDKIEKLSELYKDGILTEYEFSMKKMELLEKLKK